MYHKEPILLLNRNRFKTNWRIYLHCIRVHVMKWVREVIRVNFFKGKDLRRMWNAHVMFIYRVDNLRVANHMNFVHTSKRIVFYSFLSSRICVRRSESSWRVWERTIDKMLARLKGVSSGNLIFWRRRLRSSCVVFTRDMFDKQLRCPDLSVRSGIICVHLERSVHKSNRRLRSAVWNAMEWEESGCRREVVARDIMLMSAPLSIKMVAGNWLINATKSGWEWVRVVELTLYLVIPDWELMAFKWKDQRLWSITDYHESQVMTIMDTISARSSSSFSR